MIINKYNIMIPNTLEITNDFEWNQSVIKSEKPVLVSFYAEWFDTV